MPESRIFTIAPALRCCGAWRDEPRRNCGIPASWQRPTFPNDPAHYYCDAHREPGDTPIAGELALNRVHLTVEVFLAGVALRPDVCKIEAYDELERAVRALGGALGLIAATCDAGVGTYPQTRKTPLRRRTDHTGRAE